MPVLVARTRHELRQFIASLGSTLEEAGIRPHVGFVPTMGALHEGHASLIRRSAKENSITVVSVFVNPKQFAANEDLAKYPRTFEDDCELCEKAGAQVVFAPSVDEMYPSDFSTQVSVGHLGEVLCGAYRPGHFNGVCTVVMLLLNLVAADRAYFGLKDYQQFAIILRMTKDLEHPTRVIGVPTLRDADGLAMSSRNRYLDARARETAVCIPQALRVAAQTFLTGNASASEILHTAEHVLSSVDGFELQYCELRRSTDLSSMTAQVDHEAVLAVAGFVSNVDGVKTRLIDNVVLTRAPEQIQILLDFVHQPTQKK